eukprot:TRINITY_DN2848_c0_g1_i1.p1 TRINITY_DN2848_c0_g1~~TRINITY_DN2848_c0_g1_i1.p1  ORF type:complete len:250 (+),score=46.04 TRINITY_DN2848_c0_g1_i1:626-1375(+)
MTNIPTTTTRTDCKIRKTTKIVRIGSTKARRNNTLIVAQSTMNATSVATTGTSTEVFLSFTHSIFHHAEKSMIITDKLEINKPGGANPTVLDPEANPMITQITSALYPITSSLLLSDINILNRFELVKHPPFPCQTTFSPFFVADAANACCTYLTYEYQNDANVLSTIPKILNAEIPSEPPNITKPINVDNTNPNNNCVNLSIHSQHPNPLPTSFTLSIQIIHPCQYFSPPLTLTLPTYILDLPCDACV